MKKLKLTQLSKDEIGKNELGKIHGGALFCGCGATCNLTGERAVDRRKRRKNPPQVQSIG